MKHIVGKIAYGFSFIVALPVLLICWAKRTEPYVTLPVPESPMAAWLCVLVGGGLMLWAMADLWFRGKGLPMNAYPPEKLVTRGAYRYVEHPIYVAASVICVGVSLLFGSRSGFWLVSPVLTLAWLALVYGFENEDLQKRFEQKTSKTAIAFPKNLSDKTQISDILSVYLLVFLPWLALYEAVIFMGLPARPISTFLYWEDSISVTQWTEIFYASCYPFVAFVPWVLRQKRHVRSFMLEGWIVVSVGIFLQLVLPLVAEPKPFTVHSVWGELLAYERSKDGATAAFPSFHVAWAFLAAQHYAVRWPKGRLLFFGLAAAISVSCATTGMHSLIDIAAGVLLFFTALYRENIRRTTRTFFEKLANSWKAWQLGGLRIINHSVYVGISAFTGVLLVSMLLNQTLVVWLVCISALLGAGLWAQLVEGSSGLSRPFGYYGSILGGIVGCLVAALLFNVSFWRIMAAFALASPWIQAIGRLRCVVQGCCHGKPASDYVGIRVQHAKSRVCALSHLQNQPIHITPAYSILSNLIIGAFLWRLWYADVALPLIVGLYFILSGVSRFVEEAYRGEVQTPVWGKLKLYQWLAFGSVLFGIGLTMIPFSIEPLLLHWQPHFILTAFVFAAIAAFAMGMDFPRSTRRFSRLAN